MKKDGPAPGEAFTLDEVQGVQVVPGLAEGGKCGRCWRYVDSVGQNADRPDLCARCDGAIA